MGLASRSNSSALRILLVDEDSSARRVLRSALEDRIARPLMIMETAEPETARSMVMERTFDAIAADLATLGGSQAFHDLIQQAPGTVAYAIGPRTEVREAVEAVRAGAADYIEKPLDGPAFARRIERQFVGPEAVAAETVEGIVARSAGMRALVDQIDRIAPAAAPVLLTGESGTGKGLVARAVHAHSRRRTGPFVTIDCSGLDDAALVAALARGDGALDRADGGTLYLREISELGDSAQALLLRLLDGGEVIDGRDRRTVSVRLIASTSRRSDEITGQRRLRSDLFFRLAVLTLLVPPLRERSEDLPPLAGDLIRRAAREAGRRPPRLGPSAERLLEQHDWPGNVRQLKSLAERIALTFQGETLGAEAIEPLLEAAHGSAHDGRATDSAAIRLVRPLWMEEERLIEEAIEAFGGNIVRAAAALQISPSTIYRKRRPREDRAA